VPRWVWLPAAAGAAIIVVPFVGLVSQVPWGDFGALVTSESARAALLLSLRTSVAATLICVLLGAPLALVLARMRGPGRDAVRSVVLIPLVLPPVVAGVALLAAFGRRGLLGGTLEAAGISIAFTTVAVVVAQTFVSLPFLVISLASALEAGGEDYAISAATLGASPTVVMWRVTLPIMLPALISGAVLAFARALGEFGATITFAGSLAGVTRTVPLEIYLQRDVSPDGAVALSMLLVVVAVLVIVGVRKPWTSP
jgi:molybdate transport system permease protein